MTGDPGSAAPAEDDAGQREAQAQDPDQAHWTLLDGLRRRLDDQAVHIRKTATQVHELAQSIGALVAAERQRTRTLNLNSFIAYLIFTALCVGGFSVVYRSRAHDLMGERDRAVALRDQVSKHADDLAAAAKSRDAADANAREIWQLIAAGKRDAAATRLAESAPQVSKLDRDLLAALVKADEPIGVDAVLKTAQAAAAAGRVADAVAALEAALAPDGLVHKGDAHFADVHYQLALAQLKLGMLEKAATHLQAALAAGLADEDARFQLASALDRLGQWGRARVEYDKFAAAHPQSIYTAAALRRSAELAQPPSAPAEPPAPPANSPSWPKPGKPIANAPAKPTLNPPADPKPAKPSALPAKPPAPPPPAKRP